MYLLDLKGDIVISRWVSTMRVCRISVFMGRRQRRRAQILLIISKINLRPSVCSASSASSDIKLTHPLQTTCLPSRRPAKAFQATCLSPRIATRAFILACLLSRMPTRLFQIKPYLQNRYRGLSKWRIKTFVFFSHFFYY